MQLPERNCLQLGPIFHKTARKSGRTGTMVLGSVSVLAATTASTGCSIIRPAASMPTEEPDSFAEHSNWPVIHAACAGLQHAEQCNAVQCADITCGAPQHAAGLLDAAARCKGM